MKITFYLIKILIIFVKKLIFNSIFRCVTKSPRAILNAYNTYVIYIYLYIYIYCRPILEYASIIWSHFSKVSQYCSLIDQIERVQRLFTRILITRYVVYTNSSHINYKSYTERLGYFKIQSLELRRLKIDLNTIFKISNNYTDILTILNNCRTRGNCKQLNVIHNYDNTIKNIINNR